MATHGNGLPTWKKFAAFQVFGDYAPMQGFCVLVQVGADPSQLVQLLERRAPSQDMLDPALGQAVISAGLGLLRTGLASFAYATVEEAVVMLRPQVLKRAGAPIVVQNRLLSEYTSVLSLLIGQPVTARARIFELPDASVECVTGGTSVFHERKRLGERHTAGIQRHSRS